MINLGNLELVIASYLRELDRAYDNKTIFELSRLVVKQSELFMHNVIRQEVDRIKKEPQST